MELILTFYEIAKCGLYPEDQKSATFLRPLDVCENISSWVKNQPLGKTKVFEGSKELGDLTVLIHNINFDSVSKRCLITTWNEIPAGKGNKIYSINPKDLVGSAKTADANTPEGNIAGYPSYFYFLLDKNKYITIQKHKKLNGNPGLRRYLIEFMAKFSNKAVTRQEVIDGEPTLIIDGYRNDPKDATEALVNLSSEFEMTRGRRQGLIDEIKKNRDSIIKIVRKNKLSLISSDPKSLFDDRALTGFMSLLKSNTGVGAVVDLPVRFAIRHKPTEVELDKIIEEWSLNHSEETYWDNVGFVFKGDTNTTKWLDHSIQREKISFPSVKDESVINSASLMASLVAAEKEIYEKCGVE